ncbi:MAG: hypothetical protein MMC33_009969 [Icmadophila ericetorum]|nr:hypothetical protein [Icmadophila ericetorum]
MFEDLLFTFSLGQASATVAAALMLWTLYGIVYRLYLSPIAHFPGPWYAAATMWYEFYWDVIKRGRYEWKIVEFHERYGPIVRINPYELHISDPNYYEELYVTAAKRKTDKFWLGVRPFGGYDAHFATFDHNLHRMRRGALGSFFSKQNIQTLEPSLQATVDKLCTRFEESRSKSEAVKIIPAYAALTADIITGYCFSKPDGFLTRPNYAQDLVDTFNDLKETTHVNSHFGFVVPLMEKLPPWVVQYINPRMQPIVSMNNAWRRRIAAIISQRYGGTISKDCKSIFDAILDSDMPESEKSIDRLRQEAQTVLAGGFISTSKLLTVATFHLLSDPAIRVRLMSELHSAIPDPSHPPPLVELEKLPYLNAVVLESLRMSPAMSHRAQRISPEKDIHYKQWLIPAGTPVGMTTLMLHNDSSIFPSPYTFSPERWLPLETTGKSLEKYLFAWSRGSRNCLGINLATAEIYLGLAAIFRRFGEDMRIVDTVRGRDIDITSDLIIPGQRRDTKGVTVQFGVGAGKE